jgi:tRNA(Ile)-lysidine synthase
VAAVVSGRPDVTLGVGKLAENVLHYIRQQEFLKAGDRAGVAVSGGTDSVALLRLLLELHREIGVVLSVVHFNHHLRGAESDADELFVAQLARNHGLDVHCGREDVGKHAEIHDLSTEAAARELRYRYFRRLSAEERLHCIATGHTLDDQAETVILRLVRGAGTRGLAGIYPGIANARMDKARLNHAPVEDNQFSDHSSRFSVIRPLLRTERAQLEGYLKEIGQEWREDSSNRDLRHGRNRVRREIMPRLQQMLNPKVKEALAETAEIARAEEEHWQEEVARALGGVWDASTRRLAGLNEQPLALRRRMLRAAAESLGVRLEFRQVQEILDLESAGPALLTEGWKVRKDKKGGLQFERVGETAAIADYAYVLAVPGDVHVPETGARFEAVIIPGSVGAGSGYNPDHTLDPALLQKELTVRNWRPGDRFWPAHSKSPKKVKELLQERKLAARERQLWPVVVSAGELVWVRGFPSPARFRPHDGAKRALVIQEHCKA